MTSKPFERLRNLFFIKKTMTQLKFDKKGFLIPQRINYDIKHNERDKELINKYIENECNFKTEYNNKGEPKFVEKNEEETEGDEINEIV